MMLMNPFGWYRQLIRNPRYRAWVILGSLVYLLSPIDVSPDLIPLVGQIDDVVIMTLLLSEVFQWVINRLHLIPGDRPNDIDPSSSMSDDDCEIKTVNVKAVSID
jgi:uncharacterized membrane protein YkvA (DUF1232 family)